MGFKGGKIIQVCFRDGNLLLYIIIVVFVKRSHLFCFFQSSVEVTLPRKQMNCVQLTYKLTCVSTPKESDSDEASNRHKPVPSRLERYVFMNRKPSRYIYEIQLPVRGKYNFDILGMRTRNGDKHDTDANDSAEGNLSEEKDKLERLCQFRFICDKEPDDDIEPLPESPDIGWGPGPVCKQNGLIPLSHFEGQIYIKPGDLRHIRFRNQEDKEVQTMLVHSYLPAYDLVNQVRRTNFYHSSRQAHDVNTTSPRRRCNVMTLHRR